MVIETPWAARYNTWLLLKLTPEGEVFSFLFLLKRVCVSMLPDGALHAKALYHRSARMPTLG